jgi:hypothetical protein
MKQAIIMPASLSIATLFPDAAMRVNLPAEPRRDVDIVEKASVWRTVRVSVCDPAKAMGDRHMKMKTPIPYYL